MLIQLRSSGKINKKGWYDLLIRAFLPVAKLARRSPQKH